MKDLDIQRALRNTPAGGAIDGWSRCYTFGGWVRGLAVKARASLDSASRITPLSLPPSALSVGAKDPRRKSTFREQSQREAWHP